MPEPIVPAPNTDPATVITSAMISAMVGKVVSSSSILGVENISTHSLNALVELVYVRIGNEIMAQSLSKLEQALSATKSSLSALSNLQGLANQIDVSGRSAIPFTFTASSQVITYTSVVGTYMVGTDVASNVQTFSKSLTDIQSYQSGYYIIASSYYKPIDPYFSITYTPTGSNMPTTVAITASSFTALQSNPTQLSAYNYFEGQMQSTKHNLSGLIATLSALTPRLPNGSEDPNSLLAKLRVVYQHIPSGNSQEAIFKSTKAWVLDGYNVHNSSNSSKQGIYQQEITNAITAGESLNSTQNASVRKYLFIFEQYYQSANAILSQTKDAIVNIARKISQ